jgi:hypothetical protein
MIFLVITQANGTDQCPERTEVGHKWYQLIGLALFYHLDIF